MTFLLRGAALSLAWFALVNVVVSAAVALLAHVLLRVTTRHARRLPALWLALRLLPAFATIAFVLAVFVPSYLQYEPRDTAERFDVLLTIFAILALAILSAAAARAAMALRAARRRVRLWLHDAQPITIDVAAIPAYEIDSDRPIIALTGVFRPRLLVTRGFRRVLSDAEFAATIAHEVGHYRACDNLKRLAMRAAPDVLPLSAAARAIERQWISAAEHTADRMAGVGADARCALASALVKIARLTPVTVAAAEPISTLIGGGEIASRVQELLEESTPTVRRSPPVAVWAAAAVLLAAGTAFYPPILRGVHEATELLVHLLP